jgi:putative SOS response-associated peptidase YedK
MCGRFVLSEKTWAAYHGALSILQGTEGSVSYNIKPTQSVHIAYLLDDAFTTDTARWWFVPEWHKGPVAEWKATTFNAKIETAHEKPSFRNAWKFGRCLIPASGYYEWTGKKGSKTPRFIQPQMNAPVFFFAGLYAPLQQGGFSCTILTRPAYSELAHLHPRMPVMLTETEIMPWLSQTFDDVKILDNLGLGYQHKMKTYPVQPFGINDDDPTLIDRDGFVF